MGTLWRSARRGVKEPVQTALAWAAVLALDRRPRALAELDGLRPRRIVAVRTDRIGDLLVSSPLLLALRERWPEADLVIVPGPKNRAVLAGLPFLKAAPDFRREPASWARLAWWLARRRFDLAVSLRSEAMSGALVAAASRAPVRLTTHRTKTAPAFNLFLDADHPHHLTRFLIAAERLGRPRRDPRPVFVVSEAARHRARALLEQMGLAGRHPLVGLVIPNQQLRHGPRRWPIERLTELANALRGAGCQVLLIHGTAERAAATRMRALAPAVPHAPPLPLADLAAVQELLDLVVSAYTGPLHLADAVGTPTVAVGSLAQEALWRPLGSAHRAVSAPTLSGVAAARVAEAALALLGHAGAARP